jgi:hypothetical protein
VGSPEPAERTASSTNKRIQTKYDRMGDCGRGDEGRGLRKLDTLGQMALFSGGNGAKRKYDL